MCKYLHVVNNIETNAEGEFVTLNFSFPITSLNDTQRFCIRIPCGVQIPTGIDGYKISIPVGDNAYFMYNKYGNNLTVGELKKRKTIKGYYGSQGGGPHFITADLPVTYNCGCNNVL